MTIQLSVLLWSIICFCLMMVILNKLLFGPLLAFMDARQDRIQKAKDKKIADEQALKQARLTQQAALMEHQAQQQHSHAAAAQQARQQGQELLEQEKIRQEQELSAYAQHLEQESRELKTKLDAGVDALAQAFAQRLVS